MNSNLKFVAIVTAILVVGLLVFLNFQLGWISFGTNEPTVSTEKEHSEKGVVVRYVDGAFADSQVGMCKKRWDCESARDQDSECEDGLLDDGIKVIVQTEIPDNEGTCVKIDIKEGDYKGLSAWLPYSHLRKERQNPMTQYYYGESSMSVCGWFAEIYYGAEEGECVHIFPHKGVKVNLIAVKTEDGVDMTFTEVPTDPDALVNVEITEGEHKGMLAWVYMRDLQPQRRPD